MPQIFRRIGVRGLLFALVMSLATTHWQSSFFGAEPKVRQKLPFPAPEEERAARVALHQEFGGLLQQLQSSQQRGLLARRLLEDAHRKGLDTAGRYTRLVDAKAFAIDAGDVRTAVAAVGQLAKDFDFERGRELKALLPDLADHITESEANRDLLRVVQHVLRETLAEEPSSLSEIYDSLGIVARRQSAVGLLRQRQSLAEEVEELLELRLQSKSVERTSRDDPQDKAAHESFGRFLIRCHQDWAKGLPHLAKGDDQDLRKLAEHDLRNPTSPAEQLRLADEWHTFATQRDRHPQLWHISAMHFWYARALPKLSGSDRERVERRLREFGDPLLPRGVDGTLDLPPSAAPTREELVASLTHRTESRLDSLPRSVAQATPPKSVPAPASSTKSRPMPQPNAPTDADVVASNRKAAEWILSVKGSVGLRLFNGQQSHIGPDGKLPEGPFAITAVQLMSPEITDDEIANLAGLTEVESFGGYNLSHVMGQGLKHFESWSKLRTLNWGGGPATDALLTLLPKWPQLSTLSLNQSLPKAESWKHVALAMQLQTLIVTNTQELTDDMMPHIANCQGLQQLVLQGPKLSGTGIRPLSAMTRLQGLTLLDVPLEGASVPHLQRLTSLTQLTLQGSRLTDGSLADLKSLSELQGLNVSSNQLNGTGLAAWADHPNLRTLHLADCPLTDKGVASVVKLERINTLSMHKVALTSAHLKQLAEMKSLQQLHLNSCQLTDDMVAELKLMTSLVNLGLGQNELTDKSLETLKHLKRLQSVFLHQTKITKAGAESLKKELPKCSIHGNFGNL